jgi:hypothetical protein
MPASSAGARAAISPASGTSRSGARRVDQLLGDRPRQRLPRPWTPSWPDPRSAADGAPDKLVAPDEVVEVGVVVVDAEREAHALDRELEGLAPDGLVARVGAHDDGRVAALPGAHHDRVAGDVQQPRRDPVADAHRAVAAAASRQPVGPGRAHLDLDRGRCRH